jgi:hypothetical protein
MTALSARLFAAVEAQLAAKGLVLRRGTLIDATLVEADADVRKGPHGRPVTVEREAGFARRRGGALFGVKAHLAVDQDSGLVRRTRLTAANVNETLIADARILGGEAAVYADKAYDSLARRAPAYPGGGRAQPGAGADPRSDRAGPRHPQAPLPLDPRALSRPRPLSVGKGCLGVLRGWSVLPCVRPVDAAHMCRWP